MVGRHGALTRSALLAVPVAFLACLFVVPVAAVVRVGLQEGAGAMLQVVGAPRTWQIVGFTVLQAALSTAATIVAAVPVAVVLALYRFPGRAALRTLVLVPFVMPTVVVAAAFLALIGPGGYVGVDLSGTLVGLVLAHMYLNVAIVVRVLGSALSGIDPDLEKAAQVLGASRVRAWRRVLLPVVAPSLRASAVIVFLFCFTSFGIVQVLGAGQVRTLEVEIYRRTTYLLDVPAAAALSLLQLAAVVAMLVVVGRGRTVTAARVADAGRRPRAGWERTAVYVVAAVGAAAVLIPLVVVLWRSLSVGGQVSLAGWRTLFASADSTNAVDPWSAVMASLRTAGAATLLAVVVGGMASVGLALGGRSGWLRSIDALLLLPLGTSAVTVGLGMLLAFGRPPLDLRSTGILVVLAQALVATPFVVRVLTPALEGLDRRLFDVAAVLGHSPRKAVWTVGVPLALPAVAVAVGFAFAITIGEFGATVFLTTAAEPTLPVAIARLLARPGEVTVAAAYAASALLMLVTVALVAAVDRVRVGAAEAL